MKKIVVSFIFAAHCMSALPSSLICESAMPVLQSNGGSDWRDASLPTRALRVQIQGNLNDLSGTLKILDDRNAQTIASCQNSSPQSGLVRCIADEGNVSLVIFDAKDSDRKFILSLSRNFYGKINSLNSKNAEKLVFSGTCFEK